MWLPTFIYFFISIKISTAQLIDEVGILKQSFVEGLLADPTLSGTVLTPELKTFIDTKISKMNYLVSFTRFTQPARTTRDLGTRGKTSTIDIRKEDVSISKNVRDLHLFTRRNQTFAAALENPNTLAIYSYQSAAFTQLQNVTVEFQTNLAVITLRNVTLILLGDSQQVRVFELNFKTTELNVIQTIPVSNSHHLALWEHNSKAFLSITYKKTNSSTKVTVCQWLGRHFNFLQDIGESLEVTKTVPFSIHGSSYLALVNAEAQSHVKKTYSEIFKFNYNTGYFKLFRKLPTDQCRDIKYFQARLHGDVNHFLVVVQAINSYESFSHRQTISVIYKYEDDYFYPFQTVPTDVVQWQPIQDNHGNAALVALTEQGFQGFQYDGWEFSQSDVTSNLSINGTIQAFHTFHANGSDILVATCSECNLASNIFAFNFSSTNKLKEQYDELLTWCQTALDQLSVHFEVEVMGPISSASQRGDLTVNIADSKQQRQLAALEELHHSLSILEEAAAELFGRDWNLTHIQADHVIFSNDTFIESLKSGLINNHSVEFLLDNILSLEEGFTLDQLDIEGAVLENDFKPLSLNQRLIDDYVFDGSDITLQEMVIGNSANFTQGLEVLMINQKIQVSEKEVLLIQGDQMFSSSFTADTLVVEKLNATKKLDYFNEEVSQINQIKVNNLEVGGLLNRVNFPLLVAVSLKKASNTTQVLHSPMSVEHLEVESISVAQAPGDFFLVDYPGKYTIPQNVTFSKVYATNLKTQFLNNIKITNMEGAFNLLQKSNMGVQTIKGNVTLNNLKVNNLTSSRLKHSGDVIVSQDATVLRHLTVQDIISPSGQSLHKKLQEGLKLTDKEVPLQLQFIEPIEVYDVIADKVNGLEPHNWVLLTSNDQQVITGKKRFLGNVTLKGTVKVSNLNNVKVGDLTEGVLKVYGDQEISGQLVLNQAVFMEELRCNQTEITANKTLKINGNLNVSNTRTSQFRVWGLVNGKNFNNTNSDLNLDFKEFTTLHVGNLILGSSALSDLMQDLLNDHLVIDHGHLQLPNDVEIQNLKFTGRLLATLTPDDFKGLMSMQLEDDVWVTTDMEYETMTVLGDVFVADGCINGHNLTRLERDTVKIDEDHEFFNVKFDEDIIVEGGVNVKGNIEKLDLDEIVTQVDQTLYLEGKIFEKLVYINGSLFIEEKVNGLELQKFCAIFNSSDLKRLVIEGDVVFAKGPKVQTINNINIPHLKKSVWFRDVDANITGNLRLENVAIWGSLSVENNVEGVDWNHFILNYFSKSKPQKIPGSFTFGRVAFKSVCTTQLNANTINDIIINDIPRVLLLQDEPQTFEETPYFEEVAVTELSEDVLVNGLSLKSDVMRYDQVNIVTGPKTVEILNVENLKLLNNTKIQGVDVMDWLENALLTSGIFNVKQAKVLEKAIFAAGLSLQGLLNDHEFSHTSVMLANSPQKVTAKKIFGGSYVRFRHLGTSGLVNGVDVGALDANRTLKHGDSNIYSDVVFSGSLRVDNLNVIDQEYNGVNITQLVDNLTTIRNLSGLDGNFDKLLNMSINIETAVKDQKSLFDHFKQVKQFTNINNAFGLKSQDGSHKILTYSLHNNMFEMFELDNFNLTKQIEDSKLSFFRPVTLQGLDYLYLEQQSSDYYFQKSRPIDYGRLLSSTFDIVAEFYRAPTVSLTSFTHPATKEACLVFVNIHFRTADVFCSMGFPNQFRLKEKISFKGVYKVAAFEINPADVYLFLVGKSPGPSRESRVKIMRVHSSQEEFQEIQNVYETGLLNDLAMTTINKTPYVVFSFGSEDSTSEPGWVSIRRLDPHTDRFVKMQHIPVKNPLDVEFFSQISFEPLLLISTANIGNSLNVFRYEGVAGFRRILKGSALPVNSQLRVVGNGHFLILMQNHKNVTTVLEARAKEV